MKSILIIEQISVERAGCANGIVYGYPSVTSFGGFVHALERNAEIKLGGVSVVNHYSEVMAFKTDTFWNISSLNLEKPKGKKSGGAGSIVEEAKMHFTCSLVIECEGVAIGDDLELEVIAAYIKQSVENMRLAGGRILSVGKVSFRADPRDSESPEMATTAIFRRLPFGYVLTDRHEHLEEHHQQSGKNMLEAWLDFSALTSTYNGSEWVKKDNPFVGYLVPLCVGYKAIGRLHEPGEVKGLRDNTKQYREVEAVYSIGEWLSTKRVTDISEMMWRPNYDGEYYVYHAVKTENNDDNEFDY